MAEWLAVITITIFAVISPGPDFAMVSRNALSLSRRAGILTALGVGAGVLVHVSYSLLGIGVLIRETPEMFDVLKLVGAAYLVWLGAKMLFSRKAEGPISVNETALSDLGALRIGFLTNALNPKTTIFIVSLFMQVVQVDTPLTTRIAYGLFISLSHGRCCRTLPVKDSPGESMRLDGQHEQAHARPLPHHELVCLQRCAQEARVTADLAGQGDGLACAA